MGRPQQPLYLRDGIYYARVNAKRWSSETGDPSEASKRMHFMKIRNEPWKNIKEDYGSRVEIVIGKGGHTYSRLVQHFSDPVKSLDLLNSVSSANSNNVGEEPAKDCKNIFILLDYEFALKVKENKPPKTLKYYRQRFDAMKRYVVKHELNLDSFTKFKALDFPNYRLNETVRSPGELGFNNQKANFPTVNKEIRMYRKLWGLWKDEGRISSNPWARVPLSGPEGNDEEIEPEPYTIDEVKMILQNVKNTAIRSILIFQIILGVRPGKEVLSINKEKINAGKIWNAKKRRWDSFEYPPGAIDFYFKYIEGKTERLTPKMVLIAFKDACSKAKLRQGKPYDLRKVFGTLSMEKLGIELTQELLRHKQITTTRKFYAKTRKTERAKARNIMQKTILSELNSD